MLQAGGDTTSAVSEPLGKELLPTPPALQVCLLVSGLFVQLEVSGPERKCGLGLSQQVARTPRWRMTLGSETVEKVI